MKYFSFSFFLFSLINPLDVGSGQPHFKRFLLRRDGGNGTEKPPVDVLMFTAYIFAELVNSWKVYAEFVIHSSGVYCWSYCPQLRVYAGVYLLTKVDFIYHVMEYFPKSLVYFWKGDGVHSTCCYVESRGEALPRKMTINFSLRGPNTCCLVESGREYFSFLDPTNKNMLISKICEWFQPNFNNVIWNKCTFDHDLYFFE